MGGIFYTRSTNGGTDWFKEEVVNGEYEYSNLMNEALADNNSCPSICELRTLSGTGAPFTLANVEKNTAATWQRYNNGYININVAFRRPDGNNIFWRKFGGGGYSSNNGIIRGFSVGQNPNFKSKPAIFAAWYDLDPEYPNLTDVNNSYHYLVLIPHLENDGKLTVTARLRNYPTIDCINNNQVISDNNYIIESSGVTDFSVTSKPFINGVYRGFILYFVYIKSGNIMYRADKFTTIPGPMDLGIGRISFDDMGENYNYASFNISNDDQGQTERVSPDISLRNGYPVIAYRGKKLNLKPVKMENDEEIMLSIWDYPIIVKYKYPTTSDGESWSTPAYYKSAGLVQASPNVEGNRNYGAYLLNFWSGSKYKLLASTGSCSPSTLQTAFDAKLVRGTFSGSNFPNNSAKILTMEQSGSLYQIKPTTQISVGNTHDADVMNNLVGIIREQNHNYNFNLGPVVVKNTNVEFPSDAETSITNQMEFNNLMVSAPFSLGPNDTLILGGNGYYNYVSGVSYTQKRFSINLMRKSTQGIFLTLYSDSIGVLDTIECDYLRGFVFDESEIPEVDSFYVQLLLDSTSLNPGDQDYDIISVYSPDEIYIGEGDNQGLHKRYIHFEKGKNQNNISNVPKTYSLSQNYPNPFNPVTKINYELPKDGMVKLVIYDILGREVKTLLNEVKSAGRYTVEFNGSNFASGVYFYRIQAGDFTQVKKMLMIK